MEYTANFKLFLSKNCFYQLESWDNIFANISVNSVQLQFYLWQTTTDKQVDIYFESY